VSARWPYFPVFMRLDGREVLLVGGGEVGLRKARLLVRAGARIRAVSHELHPEFESLGIARMASEFEAGQIEGCALVVAATDDAALNRRVAAEAAQRNVPVNVVDDPAHSSFITPAIVDRAPLLLALSSAGTAPVLVRRLRERLESQLAQGLGGLAQYIGRRRSENQAGLTPDFRRRLWERFLDGPGMEAAMRGDEALADAELQRITEGETGRGEVWLVGAGPGDPDLLTLRALRLMQSCDVVLYDQLVAPEIMDLVRRDAERVHVGKRRSRHTLPQEEINAELVRLARSGKRVLRLKGGDPFIFGRGGEEIAELAANGVPFQVVPGITAASGCAAYAGIPLTHRDHAQACIFVTGHPRADGSLQLHWDALARPGQTIVIYMGLNSLSSSCEKLREHGLADEWPAALVEKGTARAQRVITGTLADLPGRVAEAGVTGASLIIVGEVVRLREQLEWFGEAALASAPNART
jgi:uroporphyrin-III C-methyltransferase/precorrin-2 dehydrogenase/sirohydrochlorin ferrochelatase